MPLRPLVLDLRQYPLCERPMQIFSSLEEMAAGHTLLVVNDRDPEPLLQQLKPVLEKGFDYWLAESGPKIWRIIVSRQGSPDESLGQVPQVRDVSSVRTRCSR